MTARTLTVIIKIMTNIYFSKINRIIKRREFKVLLPSIYVLGLIVSFLLTLLYAAFPQLVTCSALLGEEVCTPSGLFFFVALSLPGYLLVGNIANWLTWLPMSITLFFVVGVSGLIYFALGSLIDRLIVMEKTTENVTKLIIISSVILLLLIILFLI